jgi:thermosome
VSAIPATTSGGIPVIILKEGAAETKGRAAQRNNITAVRLVAEIVRTLLGPRGMDKMLVDSLGDVTITNDGATVLKEMDIQHPAAKMLVEVAKSVDNEVGDGTTTSVILAGVLIDKAEDLINKDVHPTIIVDGYRKASVKALEVLAKIAEKVSPTDKAVLAKVATTTMGTKIVAQQGEYLADVAVHAVLEVAEKIGETYRVDIDEVKVEKKAGGSLRDTKLVQGIILDKEVVHGGMPKLLENAKIALLNCPLEIEKTEFDAKVTIESPEKMKMFLDEENRMLKAMADKIVEAGANVVVCQKGIDDIAQHYLAKAGVLAVRRAKESDMNKLSKATGGRVLTNIEDLTEDDLGRAGVVEERKVETDKWVFIEKCKNPKSVTVLIRGGSQRVVDEAERSLHDALMVVKDVMEKPAILAGGGAPEAFLARKLQDYANKLSGREQLAVQKFAEALETIPLFLGENAGMDPIDTIIQLRAKQSDDNKWMGVDVRELKIGDMMKKGILEPLAVKEQIIKSATEAASMILRIDDVIAAAKPAAERPGGPGGGMGEME